jgi:hypothetical protein
VSKAFPWFESLDIIHQPHGEERFPERWWKKDARIAKTATRERVDLAIRRASQTRDS